MTSFTLQITGSGAQAGGPATTAGMAFIVQNDSRGPVIGGDANCDGYGAYEEDNGNIPISPSVAVKFDISGNGFYTNSSTNYSNSTGLYGNGGFANSLMPSQDLNPYGVNINSGNIQAVNIVYDGSWLTMTIRDTFTNTQGRYTWPIDIPKFTGSNDSWVGFGAGEVADAQLQVLSWTFSTGYNPRLATPTFSVTPGQYSSAQTVSINGPAGATIYYTTDGLEPTTSSTVYSTPIAVNSETILKAVAIQSGFTDSFVATGNYHIAPSGTPIINFPSGFASFAGLINIVGRTSLSNSSLFITDGTNPPSLGETGAFWYAAPVNIQNFNTHFQINLNAGNARGMAFVIQNLPPVSEDASVVGVTGGPFALSNGANGMGFAGNGVTNNGGKLTNAQTLGLANSVAVVFAPINGSGSYTGVFTNGVVPTTSAAVGVGGLNFQSGHPLNVTLTYSGTTLALSITDSVTQSQFTDNFTVDIPLTVGADTAFVGFTAGDYGGAAQQVNNWTFLVP